MLIKELTNLPTVSRKILFSGGKNRNTTSEREGGISPLGAKYVVCTLLCTFYLQNKTNLKKKSFDKCGPSDVVMTVTPSPAKNIKTKR